VARLSARSYSASARALLLAVSLLLPAGASALAQEASSTTTAVAGVVADEAAGALPGTRITVRDSAGVLIGAALTDGNGAFSLRLAPGAYVLLVELDAFRPLEQRVSVPPGGMAETLRLVLMPQGFSDSIVVTARRGETRRAETPQRIEVVDAVDIERSVAGDLTEVLKKNAGVEVIQYSGMLSGIGIRGFRPQFSGVNKRSLLLLDGRPSGITNLATLGLDGVERIEVLKGAASAIYGSSAMGGVVNVITRRSRGAVSGGARIGGGSFGTSDVAARAGGNLTPRIDFDLSGSTVEQRNDYRMGNGEVRPATSFATYDGTGRAGIEIGRGWRVDGRVNLYRGRDIMTPGELATGINAQGSKDLERSTEDIRVAGRLGGHDLSATAYGASEAGQTSNVTSTNPLDQPYLPYLSFDNELRWAGFQARDSWRWSRAHSLVAGVDYERVTSVSHSYARSGERIAPFSADSRKRSAGVYAEQTLRFAGGRTVVSGGGRVDRITSATLLTPLKTNFTPSASSFTVFNPSLGLKHELRRGMRAHLTAGRAFIPAEASMLTGFTTGIVGGRTQITQGNPDLNPERSTSVDLGLEWTTAAARVDVTVFRTVVTDRFVSNVVISNPGPPDPIVVSIRNGLDADISGLELEGDRRLGPHVGVFVNATHYFRRTERLTTGLEQDILNVARHTVRAGVDLDAGRVSARVSGRFVQGRKDNDFSAPGFPIISDDDFTVVDATATVRLAGRHAVLAALNNLLDAYYYEKVGFPLQGASFKLSYRLGF
jgi:vitamin B12 transporter